MDPEAHREEEAASVIEVAGEAVVEVQGEEPSAQLVEDLEEETPTSLGQEVASEDVDHKITGKALQRLWNRSSHIGKLYHRRYHMGSTLRDINKLCGLPKELFINNKTLRLRGV